MAEEAAASPVLDGVTEVLPDAASADRADVRTRVEERDEARGAAADSLAEVTDELRVTTDRAERAERENANLWSSADDLQRRLGEAVSQVSAARNETAVSAAQRAGERESWAAERAELVKAHEAAAAQLAETEQALGSMRSAADSAAARVALLERQLADARAASEFELARFRARLERLQSAVADHTAAQDGRITALRAAHEAILVEEQARSRAADAALASALDDPADPPPADPPAPDPPVAAQGREGVSPGYTDVATQRGAVRAAADAEMNLLAENPERVSDVRQARSRRTGGRWSRS